MVVVVTGGGGSKGSSLVSVEGSGSVERLKRFEVLTSSNCSNPAVLTRNPCI